jgi:hypothetical protein
MKSTPFDPGKDIPPIPFQKDLLEKALELKRKGLSWEPHVGCFVWDHQHSMGVPSPFPENVYFILNVGRFLEILGTVAKIKETLVWVPTWTQAMIVYEGMGGAISDIKDILEPQGLFVGEELMGLYEKISQQLEGRR